MSQFVGDFRVGRFERVKRTGFAEPATCCPRKSLQVVFALVQRLQSKTQPIDLDLIKPDRRLTSAEQRVELCPLGGSRDLSITDDVNRYLRLEQRLQRGVDSRGALAVVNAV